MSYICQCFVRIKKYSYQLSSAIDKLEFGVPICCVKPIGGARLHRPIRQPTTNLLLLLTKKAGTEKDFCAYRFDSATK